MSLLTELIEIADTTKELEIFIENNFDKLHDCFSMVNYFELKSSQTEVKNIHLKMNTIVKLDYSNDINISFANLLLNSFVRLGESSLFQKLFEFLNKNEIHIDPIPKISSLYLMNVNCDIDLLNNFEDIVNGLEAVFENGEDSFESIIASLVNYYSLFVSHFYEFNSKKVVLFREKIKKCYFDKAHSFLQNPVVESIFDSELAIDSKLYETLQAILDEFLGRNKVFSDFEIGELLIESGTEYAMSLSRMQNDFGSVRKLNSDLYITVKNDDIFYSLNRGVQVLKEEVQLLAYMYAFGPMHNSKLNYAFRYLPKPFYAKEINVVDWACGQGLATMTYFDYLESMAIKQEVDKVSLIEPSAIALKRASLHVQEYNRNIVTINKDFDSLKDTDLKYNKKEVTLHLFSNILDVDFFSLNNLITVIEDSYVGEQYFVIVSPYVNNTATSRINTFVDHFRDGVNFEEIKEIDCRSGEWLKTWTKVVRIFKVNL